MHVTEIEIVWGTATVSVMSLESTMPGCLLGAPCPGVWRRLLQPLSFKVVEAKRRAAALRKGQVQMAA